MVQSDYPTGLLRAAGLRVTAPRTTVLRALAVHDVDCAAGGVRCLAPADPRGLVVGEAEIALWGVFPDCRAADGVGEEVTSEAAS